MPRRTTDDDWEDEDFGPEDEDEDRAHHQRCGHVPGAERDGHGGAGCGLALFSSKAKYESGDGWPSFWNVLPNTTLTQDDYALLEERTEVHCRRCGGHLGHIFDDGPPPTHLRYCMNSASLNFVARKKA